MKRENRIGQTGGGDGDAKPGHGEPAKDALHIAQTRTDHAQVIRLPVASDVSIECNPGQSELGAQIGDARCR